MVGSGMRPSLMRLDVDIADDSEALYVRMRRYLRDRNLEFDVRRSQLELSDTLGSGQFGYVCRATYRIDGEPPVTVAVKTLKTQRLLRHPSRQVDAECMVQFDCES